MVPLLQRLQVCNMWIAISPSSLKKLAWWHQWHLSELQCKHHGKANHNGLQLRPKCKSGIVNQVNRVSVNLKNKAPIHEVNPRRRWIEFKETAFVNCETLHQQQAVPQIVTTWNPFHHKPELWQNESRIVNKGNLVWLSCIRVASVASELGRNLKECVSHHGSVRWKKKLKIEGNLKPY